MLMCWTSDKQCFARVLFLPLAMRLTPALLLYPAILIAMMAPLFLSFARLAAPPLHTLPPSRNASVLTLTTPSFLPRYAPHLATMKMYADHHNYSFINRRPTIQPPHFDKPDAVLAALQVSDSVLYLDADNMVVHHNISEKDLFPHAAIVFSGSPGFSSSHIVLFRRSPHTIRFLRRWRHLQRELDAQCHFDQAAFLLAMAADVADLGFPLADFPGVHAGLAECKARMGKKQGHRQCRQFQSCLMNWARHWLAPFMPRCAANEPTMFGRDSRTVAPSVAPPVTLRRALRLLALLRRYGARFGHAAATMQAFRRVQQLPFRWQCEIAGASGDGSGVSDGDDQGDQRAAVLTQQGQRRTTFVSCRRNALSVHPVKYLRQFQCRGTDVDSVPRSMRDWVLADVQRQEDECNKRQQERIDKQRRRKREEMLRNDRGRGRAGAEGAGGKEMQEVRPKLSERRGALGTGQAGLGAAGGHAQQGGKAGITQQDGQGGKARSSTQAQQSVQGKEDRTKARDKHHDKVGKRGTDKDRRNVKR